MNKNYALVDTSFLVAYLDERDSLHRRAIDIEKIIINLNLNLIFTDIVYGETISVLGRRISERRRLTNPKKIFYELVKKMDEMVKDKLWYWTGMVKEKFFEIKRLCLDSGGKLNFNDALLIIGAKEYEINQIISFDSDFDKYLKRIS